MNFVLANNPNSPSNSVVNYIEICQMASIDSPGTTESTYQAPCPADFDLGNFNITLDTAPGAGRSWTFTVRKNGVDTTLSVVVSGTNTTANSGNTSVHFAPGDLISVGSTPSGTPASPSDIKWYMQGNTTNTNAQVIFAKPYTSVTVGTFWWSAPHTNNGTATEADTQVKVSAAGTFSNLYVVQPIAPGGAATVAFTLRKAAVSQTLVATISAANTTANDTTHSVAVADGDLLTWQIAASAGALGGRALMGVLFTPTTYGDNLLSSSTFFDTASIKPIEVSLLGGNSAVFSGFSTPQWALPFYPCTITKGYLTCRTSGLVGAGTFTMLLKLNNNTSTYTASLSIASPTATLNPGNLQLSAGDSLSLQDTATTGSLTGNTQVNSCFTINFPHKGLASWLWD